jgi:two-component system response regulator AtoC
MRNALRVAGTSLITTERLSRAGDGETRVDEKVAGRLTLLIGFEGTLSRHPLPEAGSFSIGRDPTSSLVVNHPSVSRQHALLHLGSGVHVEDLSSANGVRLQGELIAPGERVPVRLGEVIELGEVILIVRASRGAATPRARRVWPHSYFEGRVEEQCARAERSGEEFAIVRVNLQADAGGDVSQESVDEAFASGLRASDMLALYAPDEYEALLVDTSAEDAEMVTERLRSHLDRCGIRADMGIALYPRDGPTPEALVARACEAVRGVGPASTNDVLPVAVSSTMRDLQRITEQVAKSDLSVLILGETGAGKELLAETVHRLSPRARGPFVRLHCAALSEQLLESELFGHEKGAFTGAHQAKKGLLESADQGTVLLDEIGELPLSMQVKLLRVLEDRKVQRVGAITARSIDVRFIAATNRDLEAEVAKGRFRLDLYFRLNGVTLFVPPLRSRPEEIESLARTFIAQASQRMGGAHEPALSPEALARLKAYSWPGNVRELRNALERAVLLCGRGPIRIEHLPTEKMGATRAPISSRPPQVAASLVSEGSADFDAPTLTAMKAAPDSRTGDSLRALDVQREALERQHILETLDACAGNQTRAAKMLGISRGTLLARLDAFGIPRPRKTRGE